MRMQRTRGVRVRLEAVGGMQGGAGEGRERMRTRLAGGGWP